MTGSGPAPRVALITGAARGIGAQIAREFVHAGMTVVRADVLAPSEWEQVDAAHDLDAPLDVTDEQSCVSAVEQTIAAHGGLQVLVNNAGVTHRAAPEDHTRSDWERVLGVNLTGTFLMCRAAFAPLREAGDSVIVNMASTNAVIAVRNSAAYGVSKAGIIQLTRTLAFEWARYGIRVNAVGPTIVPTEMTAALRNDADYMQQKMASIPLGRMATAHEVAATIAFLASEAAGMITGQTIVIDGGATIH